jgi:AraC-like DNA-binding protein
MLTYLGVGPRSYGERPVPVFGRSAWEFQAALSGAIAPAFAAASRLNGGPRERTLWVFPPGFEHGWTARPGESAEIAVFHFESISEPASAFIKKRGFLAVHLEENALLTIRALSEELAALRGGEDPLALLKFERAAVGLSLMALEALPVSETSVLLDRAELVATSSLAWYSEHLSERPRLTDVAHAVGCSESHLRRLFVAALGTSPQHAFEKLRISRARDMIRAGSASMKEIAEACGYDSASSFSRAFSRREGRPPRDLRGSGESGAQGAPGAFFYSDAQDDLSKKDT